MENEKRLIDANKLNAVLQNIAGHLAENGDAMLAACIVHCQDIVENQRTVDAVEVVRCKDCTYYDAKRHRCDHPNLNYDVECYDQWIDTEPDDFCSYGERRSDNG